MGLVALSYFNQRQLSIEVSVFMRLSFAKIALLMMAGTALVLLPRRSSKSSKSSKKSEHLPSSDKPAQQPSDLDVSAQKASDQDTSTSIASQSNTIQDNILPHGHADDD